jgi:predicted peptidase
MRRTLVTGLVAGLCLTFPGLVLAQPGAAERAGGAPPKPGQQAPQSFETKVALNYLLYLPEDYGKEQGKKFPLVLFLHGSGERGSDVKLVAKHGPPKLVAAGKDFPFILVSPQCSAGEGWDPATLKRLLDDVRSKYSVDPDRIYLTGLSMGGFGTWQMAMRYPNLFAAIVPICGGGDANRVKAIAKIPTWVFHGEDDPTVPIKRSEEMVEAMKNAGATDIHFTRYPKTGHDSWTKAYNDPKLYEWLLGHKRTEATPASSAGAGERK